MKKIKVNILSNIPGYSKGETVMVDVNSRGTPIERFWRRRIGDATTDNCIKVIDVYPQAVVIKASDVPAKPQSKRTESKKQEKSK